MTNYMTTPEKVYRLSDPRAIGWDIRRKRKRSFLERRVKGIGDIIRSIGSLISKKGRRKSRIGNEGYWLPS